MSAEVSQMDLVKEPGYISDVCEAGPFVWKDRFLLLECIRRHSAEGREHYIVINDVETREELARFASGYSLASIIPHGDELCVYAARWENGTWNDVTLFRSRDMYRWSRSVVLRQDPGEALLNSSVCAAGDGFVMAYESNDPQYVPFTIKFARSADLVQWEKLDAAILHPDRYAACPCIRYHDGYYYVLYLEHLKPEWWFETYMTRSRDLISWEDSPRNPILAPEEGEDINTSDPDLVEYSGKVYLYYSIGDQRTYAKLKRATFDGTLPEFLEWCYEA
jgi:alpha-L-fucosidase